MSFSWFFLLYQNSPRPPCHGWLSRARHAAERTRSSPAPPGGNHERSASLRTPVSFSPKHVANKTVRGTRANVELNNADVDSTCNEHPVYNIQPTMLKELMARRILYRNVSRVPVILSRTLREQQWHHVAQSHHTPGRPLGTVATAAPSFTLRMALSAPLRSRLSDEGAGGTIPLCILTRLDQVFRFVCVDSLCLLQVKQ